MILANRRLACLLLVVAASTAWSSWLAAFLWLGSVLGMIVGATD